MTRKFTKDFLVILLLTVFTVGCMGGGGGVIAAKVDALAAIRAVEAEDYLTESQKDIEELIATYTEEVEKAESDKEYAKIAEEFKAALAKYKTRDEIVEELLAKYREAVKGAKSEKKASELIDTYEEKFKKCKSEEALLKVSKALDKELSKVVGEKVKGADEVKESASSEKSSTHTATSPNSNGVSSSNSTGYRGNSYNNSGSSHSSGGSYGGSSSSSRPAVHSHSWKAHYATGYKTETYYKTVYKCSHGLEFSSYGSAYQHYIEAGDRGDGCNFGPVDVPYTEQVPYQYIDYYYCSCGATK